MATKRESALLYYRVSTSTQVERGQGLDVQKRLCRNHCRDNGIAILGEFSDEGVSGATIEREGLQDCLAALNGVDYVVVLNTSRLWRDDFTRAMIQRELKRADKDVRAVDSPTYTLYSDSPEDYLITGMMQLLDDYERLSISLKLKRARKQKASKGDKAAGIAPYGFRWTEIRSADRREKIVQADPTEGPVVTELFRDYLRLGSVGKLCRDLEARGILNRRGKAFSRQALHLILTNDFYIGTVRHGKVNRVGNHEPLINKITFGKVQAALNRNRRR